MKFSNAHNWSCSVSLVLIAFGASVGVTHCPARADDAPVTPMATEAAPSDERIGEAASLMNEAMNLSGQSREARIATARGSAALIPLLTGASRDKLTAHWIAINQASEVPRDIREDAYSSFFDVAAHHDPAYAAQVAWNLPDAAARAGGYTTLSTVVEKSDWQQADDYSELARRAARGETAPDYQARSLAYIADRIATLDPATAEDAVTEASSAAANITNPARRDAFYVTIVGAAAHFDLSLARRIADHITDSNLKDLANARINLSEISQTTLTSTTSDRIAALAKAAVRYDQSAIPVLLQLPPQLDVLKALSDSLPPIYPNSQPDIDASLLTRMWDYVTTADASVQRDELQSRLARLMMLHDLWRGRSWALRLAWKGGRFQCGAFLEEVLAARRSQVHSEPLKAVADENMERAILMARKLTPAAHAEALLLIAGQILNG